MRLLVIQNFDGTGLGQIGTAIEEKGGIVDLRQAHRGDALPEETGDHDGLIVLGGGQNALADEEYPYLPRLCQLMRSFADEGRAVLGVCLGSQLLARAYGAENLIGVASEFAWRPVDLTEDGAADPLFAGVPERFPIFHWHDDTFVLPRGGVRLAGNLTTHNQAFRLRRAAYGIQFHFEADRALIVQWNATFADYLQDRQPGWLERHRDEAERHGAAADAVGLTIARNWLELV
jgi:GMP synthase-like glutamine amidotransferase